MPSLYSSKTSTGWQLRADYSTSQDIANNRTLFSVDLYVYAGTSGSYNSDTSASLSAYYTIYGERKYQPYNFSTTGWKYLGSRSFYIPHNADGTKTFTFTADWHSRNATSYTPASVSISTSVTLPTIPRASSISASSFTIGSSGNITINRASSSFTHTLTYSFGSASGTIGTELGTSATWTPPNSLLSQVPTQTSKTCTITCTTYSGGTAIGTYSINVTLYVASGVVPSISEATVSPVNANSWIKEKGLYVGGFTKARIQTKATAGQGASIQSITINGASASNDWTSPILTAGQKSFIIRVTDTRGRYVEKNVSALFLEYTQPLFVTAKAVRSDALGLEIDDGTYLYAIGEVTHSSLDGNNQVQLKLRIRASGGEWQQFVNIENNAAYIQDGLLLTASYEVEIVATDLVGSNVTRLFRIATASIDFHLRHGGRGAAFGKYSEIEELEVNWNARFYKNVNVDGNLKASGTTTLGRIDASNEYLTGSLYVGGKKSTTDGKTGVAFGSSGNITMQGSSAPKINLLTGTNTSASASIETDTTKRLILKSGEVTRLQVMSNDSTYYQFAGDAFYYTGDNTAYCGGSSRRWKAIYAASGTIQTSDRNQKENIKEIDEKYEALFNELKPVSYEFIGKDHDRTHIGFVSQDIKETMDEVGLTDSDFAGYCVDYKKEYNEETGKDELVLDENGNPIELYSLRYSEFIALNTHMIQKLMCKIAQLEKEIELLKENKRSTTP